MKPFLILLFVCVVGCNSETKSKTEEKAKLTDLFIFNIHGDVTALQDSMFVIDSAGNIRPDSVCSEEGTYRDGMLVEYISFDTLGRKEYTYYQKFANGRWKGSYSLIDNKLTDSLSITLDSAGKYAFGKYYDSARKLTAQFKVLSENEFQQITKGEELDSAGKLRRTQETTYEKHIYTGTKSTDTAGKVVHTTKIVLNKSLEPETETITDSTTKINTYVYDKIDEQGNWTERRLTNTKDKKTLLVRRKYTYATKN